MCIVIQGGFSMDLVINPITSQLIYTPFGMIDRTIENFPTSLSESTHNRNIFSLHYKILGKHERFSILGITHI